MKILALDDEPAALKILLRAIEKAEPSADVVSTTDYNKALEMAETEKPEVAFLDICIGSHSGLDAARTLKKLNPKINIIFVTGYSEYVMEAISLHTSGYVMKPADAEDVRKELDNLIWPVESGAKAEMPYARTFGNFDLLVNGRPVQFSLAKAKEMLAYLIDRQGSGVSRKELAGILFENEPYTRATQNYLSKIYKALKESLDQAGVGDILCKGYNQYYVDSNCYTSDVLEYRQGVPGAINRFTGEYMNQYSWAEETSGQLYKEFHMYD